MSSTTKKTAKLATLPKDQDATALLRADHKLVGCMFAEYEKTQSTAMKKKLVCQICTDLSVHAQVEEEIFYPAVKLALKDVHIPAAAGKVPGLLLADRNKTAGAAPAFVTAIAAHRHASRDSDPPKI